MRRLTGDDSTDILNTLWSIETPAQMREILVAAVGQDGAPLAKQLIKRRTKDRKSIVSLGSATSARKQRR
ncbi:uncharacterized protein AMSG_00246 [Thecamonas trahens ATCC 50062]|uniref:Uncharacterized protein n=1 Tax=Thecamonas trahens ATCC 50062 TaxID=461836 RepID=A0A0L0D4A6_THETB|nr:hypothetical protein AMSG_00246 [Thecamonas trahens ATCC 50062]KNC46128.1 hypothetical protein AMSG_00246 [Thecamonas trahens ATCC 50062]|eukprot:XP_013763105.1 hypothetical protein AMSG_00246 [Thecamonas trahens ATCC 50062]